MFDDFVRARVEWTGTNAWREPDESLEERRGVHAEVTALEDDDERRELELLRVEVREHVNVRAEMDAEAEEREEELREAYAHVKRLQEAARIAA